MLIRFRVSNFASFKNEVEFSMIPGPVKSLSNHILKTNKSNIELLRTGAIYGANASGKSNLIKSLEFARDFIKNGVKPKEKIAVKQFKLDASYLKAPTKFEFEFVCPKKPYLYGFELTNNIVTNEWLYELRNKTEKLLFERVTSQKNETQIEFGNITKSQKRLEFLKEFAKGTRPNQLFITKCFEDQNIDLFNEVVDWFDDLEIVFPNSKYSKWPLDLTLENDAPQQIVKILDQLDTGVCGVEPKEIKPEEYLPEKLIEDFINNDENLLMVVMRSSDGQIFLLKKEKEEIDAFKSFKIVFKHKVNNCEVDMTFDMDEESDGTLRIIDLAPIILSTNKVFIVDEMDRSLHPSLCYKFLELFLSNSKNSQFIFTTHEDHLLDQELLRRDEIWFIEKDKNGSSQIYSLEEFAPRNDLNIQKGYLMGRFGAIPIMGGIFFEEKGGSS